MLKPEQIDVLMVDLREMKKTAAAFERAKSREHDIGLDGSSKARDSARMKADQNAAHMNRLEYEFHCKLVELGICDPYERSYYGGDILEPMGAFGDIAHRGTKRVPDHPKLIT
jgi:hypothetical protein